MALTPKGSGILVDAPTCVGPRPYGLLSAVDPMEDVDLHWQASGIEWESFLCSPGVTGFVDNCPPADSFNKPKQRENQFCQADPFVVVGSYDCSTVGRPAGEAFNIARQRLESWEQRTVEQVFWTGISANGPVNPSLSLGNDTCDIVPFDIVPGGSVDAVTAMAVLEDALSDIVPCGGVIHVPYAYAAYLIDHDMIKLRDGAYYTPTGMLVVLGQGYDGTGPGGVLPEAGTTWLYATGPVVLARGSVMMVPENLAEAVDRMVNDVTVRAERFYAVGYLCAAVAVRANLSCACC